MDEKKGKRLEYRFSDNTLVYRLGLLVLVMFLFAIFLYFPSEMIVDKAFSIVLLGIMGVLVLQISLELKLRRIINQLRNNE